MIIETYVLKYVLNLSVLDPAMGSGHFLVNATNLISNFLTEFSNSFNILSDQETKTSYWRRRVVENCIYGVDINPLAVELAKLSLWILSMAKDLPLSFLDHHLKCGDSLIGAKLSDIGFYPHKKGKRIKETSQLGLFEKDNNFNAAAEKAVRKYRHIETNESIELGDIGDKKVWLEEVNELLNPYKTICNFHTSLYFGNDISEDQYDNAISSFSSDFSYDNYAFFNWELEYPKMMLNNEGFDVVIGNPPYGAAFSFDKKSFFKIFYSDVHMRTPDSMNYFISRSFKNLKKEGIFSFIVSNNLLFQNEYLKTRELFFKRKKVISAFNLGDEVFEDAVVPSCLFVVQNSYESEYTYNFADFRQYKKSLEHINFDSFSNPHSKKDTIDTPGLILGVDNKTVKLIRKIQKMSLRLDEIVEEVASGISTGGDKIFRIHESAIDESKFEKGILKKVLIGREINRYQTTNTNHCIIYTTKNVTIKNYPNILNYLMPYMDKLSKKRETKKGTLPWWCLHWPRYERLFTEDKIILRQTADKIIATYDTKGFFVLNSILVVKISNHFHMDSKYCLAFLNSKLSNFIYKNISQEEGRVFAEVKPKNVRKLLIPKITFEEQRPFVELVDQILLVKENDPSKDTTELELKIDQMVYDLSDLSSEEIKIIEGDF